MPTLSFIRHGPTAWNEQGRMQGRTDVPLSDLGHAAVTDWILPDEVRHSRWFSSPLQRARQTATLMGVFPTTDNRLIEMNWGQWEGETLEELRQEYGETMNYQEALGLDFCPTGGESPRMVQDRVLPWLRDIARLEESVAAVTHKGVIRAVTALASKWSMIGKDPHKIHPATCRQFTLSASGDVHLLEPDIPLTQD